MLFNVICDSPSEKGDHRKNDQRLQHKEKSQKIELINCVTGRVPQESRKKCEEEYGNLRIDHIHDKAPFV